MSRYNGRPIVWAFEISFLVTLAASIAIDGPYPAATSLVGAGIMLSPWALHRAGILDLPWPVTAAAGTVMLLHTLGILLQLYDRLWWWDTMTHLMATIIIAMVTSLALLSFDVLAPEVRMPLRAVPAATLAAVVLMGVIWEVLEFAFDGALGLNMQYSLDDTATDLTFDILGGGLVSVVMVPLLGTMGRASRRMLHQG